MSRILITGARAPVALHLARCFTLAGHAVTLADSLAFPIGRATKMAAYVRLPSPRAGLAAYGRAVTAACNTHRIDLVVPTCEEVFYLARIDGLPLFAPGFDGLRSVHDKFRFTQLARGLGADAAETQLLATPADVAAFDGDPRGWVFKPVWSRFGDRALIRPETCTGVLSTQADPWIAQRYLPGEELCVYAVAIGGEVRALQAYRPLYRAGRGMGAGVLVEPVEDTAIDVFVTGFARRLDWTGQVSFDFRRDADGDLHVLECNPRATTGGHFFAPGDGLAEAILGTGPARASVTAPLGVGLAMWLYGLPNTDDVARWRRDYRRMQSLLETPEDRPTAPWQMLALGEAVWRAVSLRQGLKAAMTADIEWNGETL